MAALPKLIYIFNVSYFRTPIAFFSETGLKNPIIHKESQKTLSRNTPCDPKLYYRVMVTRQHAQK